MEQYSIYTAISDFIFMEDLPEKADAIFIPGGYHCELPEKAAELYKQGFAPIVIPTGKYSIVRGHMKELASGADRYTGNYRTEAEFYGDVLYQNGVPRESIFEENESEYTYQNALFTKRLLDEKGIVVKKAIIVCKAFHSRRSYMYYQREFPDTQFFVVPVKGSVYPEIQKDNWYLSEAGRKRVMGEMERIGVQFV